MLSGAADFAGAEHTADEGLEAGEEACAAGWAAGAGALAEARDHLVLGLPRLAQPEAPLLGRHAGREVTRIRHPRRPAAGRSAPPRSTSDTPPPA